MSEARVVMGGRVGGCWGSQAHAQFLTAFCFKDEKQRLGKVKAGPTELCAGRRQVTAGVTKGSFSLPSLGALGPGNGWLKERPSTGDTWPTEG